MDELILCLQWILYAKRPLKCEELYFAILAGVEPEELTVWNSELITRDDMGRFILNSSKGLAEMTKSRNPTVQFIHESVRDFLLQGNGLDRLQSNLENNFPGLSHQRLKQCCQIYITIDISQHLPLTEPLPVASSKDAADLRQLVSEKFPFLEYAVQNILYHADAADGHGIPQDSFLENFPLGKWITLNNLFERYEIRRYTSGASQLYISAQKDLPNLIRTILKGVPDMDIEGERYGYPVLAALAHGNERAVKALLTPSPDAWSEYNMVGNNSLYPTSTELQEVVSFLLQNRRDMSSQKGQSLLSQAIKLRSHCPYKGSACNQESKYLSSN